MAIDNVDAHMNWIGGHDAAVAGSALIADHDAAVKFGRRPGAEPCLVTGVAVSDRNTLDSFVRRVIGWPAVGGGESAAVTA